MGQGSMNEAPMDICVVTRPHLTTGAVALSKFMEVLGPSCRRLYLVAGASAARLVDRDAANLLVTEINAARKDVAGKAARVIYNVRAQIVAAYRVMRLAGKVDVFIFVFATDFILPLLLARLLRRKTVFMFSGSTLKQYRRKGDRVKQLSHALQDAGYYLFDRIVVHSPSVVPDHRLEKHGRKIDVCHLVYCDFDTFRLRRPLSQRPDLIGFIGKLSPQKGVIQLAQAIPLILEQRADVSFFIGGDGVERAAMERILEQAGAAGRVQFSGWLPYGEVAARMNDFKLMVITSAMEAGPYVAYEAMACGTPVVATPVGSIPDVIRDGQTGFIMEDNSPRCICRHVIRALDHPDLDGIGREACAVAERELAFEQVAKRLRGILSGLLAAG